MRITPKRAARALKRRLHPVPKAMPTAPVAPAPAPPRERVMVRQLVLPKNAQDGPQHISELDRTSLLGRYALPPLERMAPGERTELVDSLLSVQRMEALGLKAEELEFPEASWKLVYNEVWQHTHAFEEDLPRIDFTGNTATRLTAFLQEHAGCAVHISSSTLLLDGTILVPSGTALYGHGTRLLASKNPVEKAILLNAVTDVLVDGFDVDGCCDYPIYVKRSERFLICNNLISRCRAKAITVMGVNRHFSICGNRVTDTGNGAVFLHGDLSLGVIEHNLLERVGGTWNFSGGIVFSALDIVDIDTAFNRWQKQDLRTRVEAPHDLVITQNVIRNGASNGLYSHAGWRNYIVGNVFEGNNKEGMCLDFGTCGTYVAHNIVRDNGGRNNMDAEQLKGDFIQDFGILPDGSSPAKVPGVSLDNACYNVLYQNEVSANSGTGIKMVRAGARNVLLCNLVTDNNAGQNDRFHFFGIELGTDLRPDYESDEERELDFAPCFENIIARNVVSGPHYSGIFLGRDAYINDAFDNVIGGAGNALECVSEKLNANVNNAVL